MYVNKTLTCWKLERKNLKSGRIHITPFSYLYNVDYQCLPSFRPTVGNSRESEKKNKESFPCNQSELTYNVTGRASTNQKPPRKLFIRHPTKLQLTLMRKTKHQDEQYN